MGEVVKSGTLAKYSDSVFGNKWKKVYVTINRDSWIRWYERQGDTQPKRSVQLKKVAPYLAFGEATLNIPFKPEVPKPNVERLIAIPHEGNRNTRLSFFLCNTNDEMKSWVDAIMHTLPPPPQFQAPPANAPPANAPPPNAPPASAPPPGGPQPPGPSGYPIQPQHAAPVCAPPPGGPPAYPGCPPGAPAPMPPGPGGYPGAPPIGFNYGGPPNPSYPGQPHPGAAYPQQPYPQAGYPQVGYPPPPPPPGNYPYPAPQPGAYPMQQGPPGAAYPQAGYPGAPVVMGAGPQPQQNVVYVQGKKKKKGLMSNKGLMGVAAGAAGAMVIGSAMRGPCFGGGWGGGWGGGMGWRGSWSSLSSFGSCGSFGSFGSFSD